MEAFWQLFGNFLATFWQLFGNFLATFWQLFGIFLGNFLETVFQIFGNFLAAFLAAFFAAFLATFSNSLIAHSFIKRRQTALHIAVNKGYVGVVKKLLDLDVRPSLQVLLFDFS